MRRIASTIGIILVILASAYSSPVVPHYPADQQIRDAVFQSPGSVASNVDLSAYGPTKSTKPQILEVFGSTDTTAPNATIAAETGSTSYTPILFLAFVASFICIAILIRNWLHQDDASSHQYAKIRGDVLIGDDDDDAESAGYISNRLQDDDDEEVYDIESFFSDVDLPHGNQDKKEINTLSLGLGLGQSAAPQRSLPLVVVEPLSTSGGAETSNGSGSTLASPPPLKPPVADPPSPSIDFMASPMDEYDHDDISGFTATITDINSENPGFYTLPPELLSTAIDVGSSSSNQLFADDLHGGHDTGLNSLAAAPAGEGHFSATTQHVGSDTSSSPGNHVNSAPAAHRSPERLSTPPPDNMAPASPLAAAVSTPPPSDRSPSFPQEKGLIPLKKGNTAPLHIQLSPSPSSTAAPTTRSEPSLNVQQSPPLQTPPVSRSPKNSGQLSPVLQTGQTETTQTSLTAADKGVTTPSPPRLPPPSVNHPPVPAIDNDTNTIDGGNDDDDDDDWLADGSVVSPSNIQDLLATARSLSK